MKNICKLITASLLLSGLTGCEYIDDMPLVARYIAKNVCTGVFVEGFQETQLVNEYVTPIIPQVQNTWNVSVDYENETVSVANKVLKHIQARAIHRSPIGCVSPLTQSDQDLYAQSPIASDPKTLDPLTPWPLGSGGIANEVVEGIDYQKIETVFDEEFNNAEGKNTVALLVVYNGELIAERYHSDIDGMTPLKGYSMSKSVVNGLVGVLNDASLLSLDQVTGVEQWQGDERANITLEQLMHMESGLEYTEHAIGDTNDQGKLFYGDIAPIDYAQNLTLAVASGTTFNYSSGDNLLAAKIIQDAVGGTTQSVFDLYKAQFFDRIDAVSALAEFDEKGTFLSPESLFLSTRDWARFAQLYMNNGVWNGERILSEDWIDYSLTPSQFSSQYGANLWVNQGREAFPSLPEDTFAFYGALERFVIAVPSRQAIIVRIGYTHNRESVNVDQIAAELLTALPLVQ